MTAPLGAPSWRDWKPSAYQAAVALSGVSAALGLGREGLILHRLGASAANDTLQFALSVTYTIALLGEPLRLGALNLLQRRLGLRLWTVIGIGIVVAAVLMTLLYGSGDAEMPRSWLVAAGAAGAANLGFAWVLPRAQRSGPFLPVHFVTVMPNIFMVTALLIPASSDQSFAARVVALFLLAPLLQLVALGLLRHFGDHPPLGPAPTAAEGLRPIGWHAVGAAGGQTAQFLMRTAFLAAPEGTLTAFSMTLRVTDSLRAIFVDSYIASRVRRWAAGERATSPLLDGRWLTGGALGVVALAGLLVALLWTGAGRWISPTSAMLVIGAYLVLALRVRYQSLNTSAQPIGLVKRMAGLELAVAGGLAILSVVPGAPLAMLPWLVYVAKPAAGLRLVSIDGEPSIAPEA